MSTLTGYSYDNLTQKSIQILPLGAGQDVGRSCIVVSINGYNIMLDCGMHMGYQDNRRFPDFNKLVKVNSNITNCIDCVIISHFHLDHCGALPYLTEKFGYQGPIYMTYPTKAIAPILLGDMCKIMEKNEKQQESLQYKSILSSSTIVSTASTTNTFSGFMPSNIIDDPKKTANTTKLSSFSMEDINNCMKKVTPIQLHQTVVVKGDLQIKFYYAGHVLGACMVQIKVKNESVVYTGDYNMTPDRHLGAAWIDKCEPDVLITESTYATTVRDSKRAKEREFISKVHECVKRGGKVLIPVFALGRAQELCILIDEYWDRMRLNVPIYFSGRLTERANEYYKLFISWTNESIKESAKEHNPFDFKHIKAFNMNLVNESGPMVLFASPGMLHTGLSLDVFKRWCPDSNNMIILPGYCVAGTVGAKVLAGEKTIQIDPWTSVQVNMSVENLSFSAHADAKGIVQLIKMTGAKNVVLVHGEKTKMSYLKNRIKNELNIPCFDPCNFYTLTIPLVNLQSPSNIKLNVDMQLVRNIYRQEAASSLEKWKSSLKRKNDDSFSITSIHIPHRFSS